MRHNSSSVRNRSNADPNARIGRATELLPDREMSPLFGVTKSGLFLLSQTYAKPRANTKGTKVKERGHEVFSVSFSVSLVPFVLTPRRLLELTETMPESAL
jgi:hypothetical protein